MEQILFDALEIMQVKLTSFIFDGLPGFFENPYLSEGAKWSLVI